MVILQTLIFTLSPMVHFVWYKNMFHAGSLKQLFYSLLRTISRPMQCCDLLRPFAWNPSPQQCWHLLCIVWNRVKFFRPMQTDCNIWVGQQQPTMLRVVCACCVRLHGPLDFKKNSAPPSDTEFWKVSDDIKRRYF